MARSRSTQIPSRAETAVNDRKTAVNDRKTAVNDRNLYGSLGYSMAFAALLRAHSPFVVMGGDVKWLEA